MEIFSLRSLFLLIITTVIAIAAEELNRQELDAAFYALRFRGYTLFPNAIATSDVLLRLHSASSPNCSLTFFSPTDSLLFSLDFSSPASVYTRTLLLHVSPRRLSASDLRSLSRPQIDSLLPNHGLLVSKNSSSPGSLTVNGVHVSMPDLFLGSDIAVHGLDGLLDVGSRSGIKDDSSGELPSVSPSSWCSETCASPPKSPESSPPAGNRRPELTRTPGTRWHDYKRSVSGELAPVSQSGLCETCASPTKSPVSSPPAGSRRPKLTRTPDTTGDHNQRRKLPAENAHLHNNFSKYNPYFPL